MLQCDPLAPGTSCPAVLIGRFTILARPDALLVESAIREMGQQALSAPDPRAFVAVVDVAPEALFEWRLAPPGSSTIIVTCPRCLCLEYLPVNYERYETKAKWRIVTDEPLSIEPSALTYIGGIESGVVCNWMISRGTFCLLPDSTPHSALD